MSRISIADIVRETGLSRATIDRVIHNRYGVHARTKSLVERAISKLTSAAVSVSELPPIDIALRLDRGMMDEMVVAAKKFEQHHLNLVDLVQMDDEQVLEIIKSLCEDSTRPLILTVKNTAPMISVLSKARRRGKRVIALISDLPVEARDVFIGIDNRAAGETSAFLVGRMLGDRPTSVGFVLGDHAYRCHEDREIGFRAALRTHFPKVVLAAEAIGQDNAPTTYIAVKKMIETHPSIGAIYNVAGGHLGLAQAIQDLNRVHDIMIISHEANELTVPLLKNKQLDFVISQNPDELLSTALNHVDPAVEKAPINQELIDFYVHTAFNVPKYAR